MVDILPAGSTLAAKGSLVMGIFLAAFDFDHPVASYMGIYTAMSNRTAYGTNRRFNQSWLFINWLAFFRRTFLYRLHFIKPPPLYRSEPH
jgi:hypothetical protein